MSVEDRVDRRAPLLPVPDSFTPLDPSPPREMVLMVNGFRSFCPSAKLSKDKKVWVKTQKQWWIFYACDRFKIECNYVYREDFLLIKFVKIPNIISVRLTWHPPFWGWQGWCRPWTQTGGPVPGTGDRSCGAHTGWPGWRITACPGPSLEPTEQQHRVRQRAKYSRTGSGKGAKYFRTGSDRGHSVPKTASQCTCLMVL